jgi:hypothetical protein
VEEFGRRHHDVVGVENVRIEYFTNVRIEY